MRLISVLMIALVFVVACEKDKFTTKPQLRFKSVNSNVISNDNLIILTFTLTDKEGDFADTLWFSRSVKNPCVASNFIDSSLRIPSEFLETKGLEGEIVITLDRNIRGPNTCQLPGGAIRPDTAVYKLWTVDKAGNQSDTAFTSEIIILN
jgi:hypothetical protein